MERTHPKDAKFAVRRGRPKTVSDEDRRQAILDAAYSVFTELGYSKTTTAAIATRAKTSKRIIYSLFADQAELFATVIAKHRHLILELPRPPDEKGNALDILIKIFRLDISAELARERDAMLNLIVRESVLSPALSTYLYERHIISFRDDFIEWLVDAQRRGLLAFEDVEVCAGMLMDVVFGALLPRRSTRTEADRESSNIHIKKRLGIILQGLNR